MQHNFNNIWYANDLEFNTENDSYLQNVVDVVFIHSKPLNLNWLYCKKTEMMVVSKKKDISHCSIYVNGEILRKVGRYNYFGTVLTSGWRCISEIRTLKFIILPWKKAPFSTMRNMLNIMKMPIEMSKSEVKCYIEPKIVYTSETSVMNKQAEKQFVSGDVVFAESATNIVGRQKHN